MLPDERRRNPASQAREDVKVTSLVCAAVSCGWARAWMSTGRRPKPRQPSPSQPLRSVCRFLFCTVVSTRPRCRGSLILRPQARRWC